MKRVTIAASVRFLLLLLGLLLPVAIAPNGQIAEAALPTADAVADFQVGPNANPNGVWSYGYTASRGSAFIPYTQYVVGALGFIDAWLGWISPYGDGTPAIQLNTSGVIRRVGTVTLPPDALLLHPSQLAHNSVVRWTAPQAGLFQIEGRFQGVDQTCGDGTTDVAVLHNSSTELFAGYIRGFDARLPFSLPRTVNAGDTIDFTVGLGVNSFWCDNTGLAATVSYVNRSPMADAGGPYLGTEGASISFAGSGSDPDAGDTLSYSWDFGDATPPTAFGSSAKATYAYADNGTYTATLTAKDSYGAMTTSSTTVSVANAAPTVGAIADPIDPVQVNTIVSASSNFTDPGTLDVHTAVWYWGDGSWSDGVVVKGDSSVSGSVSGSHTYTAAGVYTIILTVTDDGDTGQGLYQYVVAYNPDGGSVNGGGVIISPPGAYAADPPITGRAVFGFISGYQRGAISPSGHTQFLFHIAGLSFDSSSYEWLVVSGPKAQFKGTGAINGSGEYGFILTAVDGQVNGGGGEDRFRIKIWDKATGVVVYDNQMGASDTDNLATVLVGGRIVIHNK